MRMLAGAGGGAALASITPPSSLAPGAALLALSLPPQAASRASTPVAVINFRCETKLQFSFMLVSMFYRFLPPIVCGLDWFVILLPKKYGKDKYSAECCWACTAPLACAGRVLFFRLLLKRDNHYYPMLTTDISCEFAIFSELNGAKRL